ncbi:MAG: response regulator [Eubacteriales bacterium]|nr:response regulator [Eubacteriales bacterium]
MYPILIVDDETLAKVTLQNIIQSHPQFNLAGSASNGAEALEFCAEHSVAAVITDLQMPVMGGVEFIKRLRETGFNGPILALSNYSDFELVRGAMKEGAFDYLLKADMKDNIMYEYLDRIYELIADDEEKRRTTYEKEQKDDKRNADLTEIAFRQYLQNAGSVIDEDLLLQSLPKGIFNCILVRATMKSDHLGPLVSYEFMC